MLVTGLDVYGHAAGVESLQGDRSLLPSRSLLHGTLRPLALQGAQRALQHCSVRKVEIISKSTHIEGVNNPLDHLEGSVVLQSDTGLPQEPYGGAGGAGEQDETVRLAGDRPVRFDVILSSSTEKDLTSQTPERGS